MREFDAIYEQQVRQVYAFFAYLLDSREDAEDLTQQTFERALRSWHRYNQDRGSEATWLMAIARNLLIDHSRAQARRPHLAEVDLEELGVTSDHPRVGLDPEIERALAGLGPRERELIALRFGADLTSPEIARLTGLSVGNAQQILARALRRIRAGVPGPAVGAGRRAGAA